ncbi:hypothetical protein ASE08_24130 [Rhizobacter sp. Root16D2]|nr:hypothetical protein ASC88_23830 [Rhizobacter sp. Root29]KQW06078.1 hypothetical protein ASC98_26170 [Rhizobacter sp. Root1238]KRB19443.1 hypothetical protein ASE08_24130 [Rhizobacter sp. Root16D2]
MGVVMGGRMARGFFGGLLLAACAVAMAAEAVPPAGYAVVSLIGDKLSVVTHEAGTGTTIERNRTQALPVSGGVFDADAMTQAEAALKRLDAGARVSLYDLSSPAMFEQQDRFLDGGRLKFSPAVVAAMRKDGATHLLLVTKQLATARLQAGDHDSLGSGQLEGLGFYIDRAVGMINPDTGETGRGFFAPYFFARVSLIDLASLEVVKETRIKANFSRASTGVAQSPDAWDALTPKGKIDALKALIDEQVPKAVEALVAGLR